MPSDSIASRASTGRHPSRRHRRRDRIQSWLVRFGFSSDVTLPNVVAFLVHCSASILFLVFLNSSQPFLIHQLQEESRDGNKPSSGSLSGSLIFYDELLSTIASLVWGATAELAGLAAVTSLSYVFIALGLVGYTIPHRPWPDLIPARLVFAIGGSGATAMLSGILAEFSNPQRQPQDTHERSDQQIESQDGVSSASLLHAQQRDSEANSEVTLRPSRSNRSVQDQLGDLEAEIEAEQGSIPSAAADPSLSRRAVESASSKLSTKPRQRHGRLAALAGIFTGFGALVAVFGLLRLPQLLAKYLEDRPHPTFFSLKKEPTDSIEDVAIRRATIVTFWLVAAFSLLVAVVTALGLRNPKRRQARLNSFKRSRYDPQDARVPRTNQSYGTMTDSTIAIMEEDPRHARRARLRHRLARNSQTSWLHLVKMHAQQFFSAAVGGFRLVAPIYRRFDNNNHRTGVPAEATDENDENQKEQAHRWKLALELRMAYLGGALARAFTIGTTAFLPLLISHHYYTSGRCKALPSPDPNNPLPSDELKKLCRTAFTATSIIGGTVQLTALLFSPVIGILCDRFSPTFTISLTSMAGAVGFVVLGMSMEGLGIGNNKTGEEIPDPMTTASILAAMAIGIGQIGAIVASLASCARGRAMLTSLDALASSSLSSVGPGSGGGSGPNQRDEGEERSVASESETLMPRRRPRQGGANPTADNRTESPNVTGGGAGAIAGAYTCTGSIAILVVSKLGGSLFDLYTPSPFLLIAGFSAFVSLWGFATLVATRYITI